MFYIRLILVLIWLVLVFFAGMLLCLFRWGDINLNHWVGTAFSRGACLISGVRIKVEGEEYLRASQPCIYVANHQSGFDLVLFGSIFPKKTIVIGKKSLIWIPAFGIYFKAAGNILLDRERRTKAFQGLAKAVSEIRRKKASVWIFPEGTRNQTQNPLLPFKKGAFYMAIDAGIPVVPVVASSLSDVVQWRERKLSGGEVLIRVLPPVPTIGMTSAQADELCKTVRDRMLEAFPGLST